jgi:hypothetical protein
LWVQVAAQNTPAAAEADAQEEDPAENSDNGKRWFICYFIFCLKLVALGYFVFGESFLIWVVDGFLTIVLTIPLTMVCFNAIILDVLYMLTLSQGITNLIGLQSSVYRNLDGSSSLHLFDSPANLTIQHYFSMY